MAEPAGLTRPGAPDGSVAGAGWSSVADIALNPDVDLAAARAEIAARGFAQLKPLWDETTAGEVLAAMEAEPDWNLVAFLGGRHGDFSSAAFHALPEEKRRPLTDLAARTAGGGFGYLYENFPIYDVWHRSREKGHPLFPVFEFLNGAPFLSLMREVTGCADIAFADAQATRYRPGHFLTLHTDDAPGRERRAAFVINLTRRWRADWGGLLLFHSPDGNVEAGLSPVFNAVNVFLTPRDHSVSVVAPYAGGARYAITGWLRAGPDPGP